VHRSLVPVSEVDGRKRSSATGAASLSQKKRNNDKEYHSVDHQLI
jgi:hypothetical protein